MRFFFLLLFVLSSSAYATDVCMYYADWGHSGSSQQVQSEMICTNAADSQVFPPLVFAMNADSETINTAVISERIKIAKIYLEKGYSINGDYFVK